MHRGLSDGGGATVHTPPTSPDLPTVHTPPDLPWPLPREDAPHHPRHAAPRNAHHPGPPRKARRMVLPRSRREAPGAKVAGNRLLVVMLFWAMLAAGVALWFFNTPPSTLGTPGDAVTAAGRVTGLIGGFVLMAQVLMMSRVSWLENWVGGHDLMRWHRWLGTSLVVTVPAHAGLITAGYALTENVSIIDEAVTLFTTYEDMVGAYAATGIMVAVAALAVRRIRRRLPYELWHWLHLATYAILFLGYGHQFANGAELSRGDFAHWYWTGLYALVIACLVWGRVVEPLWLNGRHRLRVLSVVRESESMFSVYIGGRDLNRLEARAGQYFRWRFMNVRGCWQSHPFSLSAAPNQQWLRLTINAVGRHTKELRNLRPGTGVLATGPSGTFTADHRVRGRALLIAAGSGIAPIRALLEELPGDTLVIYRATNGAGIVFGNELRDLARRRGFTVRYVLGSRDEPEPRRLFSPEGLRELVPDVRQRDVYVCGPPGMVAAAVATLRRLRVRRRQIHLDPFEF